MILSFIVRDGMKFLAGRPLPGMVVGTRDGMNFEGWREMPSTRADQIAATATILPSGVTAICVQKKGP